MPACLLASSAGAPHPVRLLITCRHPFTLPGAHGPVLGFRHLGPLSRSASAELAMSLPALRLLSEREPDRARRLLAGHPRAIEYLDAAIDRYPSDIDANVIAAGPPCAPRTLPFGERRSQSRRLTVRREDVGA
ncbi:MAG TPA: hypothetical protein DHU96_09380 [Actinobacteria bacterium]|nr:hypothetical protein [Actinomycetota bacterium]